MPTEFHIGIDDTDSRLGGCTTYTAALVFEELRKRGFAPADFPWLVRLNPNIPWKTRGNGALALHFRADERRLDDIKEITLKIVEQTTDPSIPSTDPAVVFLKGSIPKQLIEFASKALNDLIHVPEARELSRLVGAETHLFKGSRGLVGSLAAIGLELDKNHTFEIIAYRTKNNLGTPRKIDPESVKEMDLRFHGRTFNNLDPETGRVLICPHGPDPVLFGIRGEDPLSLLEAFSCVRIGESVERVMIFKTNHGTDAHLTCRRDIRGLRPYQSAVITGIVETRPRIERGGHVFFSLRDETETIDCAAYEPTGSLRMVVLQLFPGDRVRALGGVRLGARGRLTLNLEKLEVLELATRFRWENPRCFGCGSSCESMGRGKGFRCRKCGRRYPKLSKIPVREKLDLKRSVYMAPPRAQRHLTKPESRLNLPLHQVS